MTGSYMDIREFVELGYLQEVNRKFLHPLGLALEVTIGGSFCYISGVVDNRDSFIGTAYPDLCTADARKKSEYVAAEFMNNAEIRDFYLGYIQQSIPEESS